MNYVVYGRIFLCRSPRRDRRGGGGGGGGGGVSRGGAGKGRRAPPERRIFVSNIPFEMKWQEVKDLFRESVGDVTYVELFNDEDEKSRGCGILEFGSEELAKKAVEKMHRSVETFKSLNPGLYILMSLIQA